MAYGFKLVGKAGRQSPDYVPSLIGVRYKQEVPSPDDAYFERVELPDYLLSGDPINLKLSQWLCYDEVSSAGRDPILEVRVGPQAFYSPASDLRSVFEGEGATNLLDALQQALTGRTR